MIDQGGLINVEIAVLADLLKVLYADGVNSLVHIVLCLMWLIDKDMKKRDLERCAGISHYTINKLNHGENVTTDILGKICKALGCTMNDIMEFIDDDSAQ